MTPLWLFVWLAIFASCSQPTRHPTQAAPWVNLFDGQSLAGWESIPFGGEGEIELRNGIALLPMGSPMTGLRYPASLPVQSGFELELRASRRMGTDFFSGLTFPVGDSFATVILGGWGGALCGLSCLDGQDASENSTKTFRRFVTGEIYTLLVRVERDRLRAWLDGEELFDVALTGRVISLRPEMLPSVPLGVASFVTAAGIHSLRWRKIGPIAD